MNTIKKYITLTVLIFCTYFLYAQKADLRNDEEKIKFEKNLISSTSFIFEGTVISQKCYRQSPKGRILTCSTIEITKILKGSDQIKLGTIRVLTSGGNLPAENSKNKNVIAETNSAGGLGLVRGGTFVIFGSLADTSISNGASNISSDNNPILLVDDIIGLYRLLNHFKSKPKCKDPEKAAANFPVAEWNSVELNFKTVDELYTYLNDKCSLTIQEEKK
jgi:hypothetical protein